MQKLYQQVYADPGITRDGTAFDASTYVAGKWVRFYKKRPQKIGGYLMLNQGQNEIARSIFPVGNGNNIDIYAGYSGNNLQTVNLTLSSAALLTFTADKLKVQISNPPIFPPLSSLTLSIVGFIVNDDDIPIIVSEEIEITSNHELTSNNQYISIISLSLSGGENIAFQITIRTSDTFIVLLAPSPQLIVPSAFFGGILVYNLNPDTNIAADPINRSPTLGPSFIAGPQNYWRFDDIYGSDGGTDSNLQNTEFVLAHVAPTANAINSYLTGQSGSSEGQIYYGVSTGYNGNSYQNFVPMMQNGTPFSITTPARTDFQTADNGICVIGGYIFALNNNGKVCWNTALPYIFPPNADPTMQQTNTFTTQFCLNYWNPNSYFIIGSDNFIYGAPVRVGGEIGGLFWTASSVVRATRIPIPVAPTISGPLLSSNTQDPGQYTWTASYVSTISTCISAKSIVSYDPFFYWVGSDAFYQYNGAVSEIVNETNKLWFFDNLNQQYSAKITSFVNTQFHEWWILFPMGTSTENNWALVYNILNECWFDTPINRSFGVRSNELYSYPILTSSNADIHANGNYPIFAHEYNYDAVYGGNTVYQLFDVNTTPLVLTNQTPIPLNPSLPSSFSSNLILFNINLKKASSCQLTIFGNNNPHPEILTFNSSGSQFSSAYTSIQSVTPTFFPPEFKIFLAPLPITLTGYLPYIPLSLALQNPSFAFVAQAISLTIEFPLAGATSVEFVIKGTLNGNPQNTTLTFTESGTQTTGNILFTTLSSISYDVTVLIYPKITSYGTYDGQLINNNPNGLFTDVSNVSPETPVFIPYGEDIPITPKTVSSPNSWYFAVGTPIALSSLTLQNNLENVNFSNLAVDSSTRKDIKSGTISEMSVTYSPNYFPIITGASVVLAQPGSYQPPVLQSNPTINNLNTFAIPSYFTTLLSLEANPPNTKNAVTLNQVTLDLDQEQIMTLAVSKFAYPRSPTPTPKVYPFMPTDTFLTMSENGTILLLTFSSNVVGGYYLMGKTLIEYIISDSEREEPV